MLGRTAKWILVAVWIVALAPLFVADVYDETNGLILLGNPSVTTSAIVALTLKTARPVPTLFAGLIIHALPPEVAWRLLRVVNIALLLAALALLLRALREWVGRDARLEALFTWTYLFSGGAIIVATWYANIFDATVMFLIAAGMLLIARQHFVAAGIVFGAAFFCKETAAMVFPLLLLLMAIGRLRLRDAVRVAAPALAIGALYFAFRGLVVPLGSAADTHQFHLRRLAGTAIGLIDTFWTESMWGEGPAIIGFIWFAVSMVALRGWRARLAFTAFTGCAIVIYMEMFDIWQGHTVMHYLMFVGRLYFIPVVLTLFVFALDNRWWAMAILALPLAYGAVTTYVRYQRFQRSYRSIYRYASHAPVKPVRIYYPMKSLDDARRGVQIGDLPDARLQIDTATGKLVPR